MDYMIASVAVVLLLTVVVLATALVKTRRAAHALAADLELCQGERSDAQGERARYESELAQAVESNSSKDQSLTDYRAKAEDWRRQGERMRQQEAALRTQMTALRRRSDDLDTQLKGATSELTRYRTKYDAVEDAEREVKFLARAASQLREEQEARLAKHREQLERAKQEHEGKVEKLRFDIFGLETDTSAKRLDIERLESQVDQLKAEISKLEDDLHCVDLGLYKPHAEWGDSEQFKQALDAQHELCKQVVKDGLATVLDADWSTRGHKEGKELTKDLSKLVLRAFNSECEAALGNLRWNNFGVMKNRVVKSFDAINKVSAKVFVAWKLRLSQEYLQARLEELQLTHEHKEQQEREREEQRRIREQMREEERAQRELAKAHEEAEADEQRVAKALAEVRLKLESARAEDAHRFNERIAQLEAELAEAHEKKERAKSLAEMTRIGHVYIISNIGSFGENVFKIGMTRRADPNDRIKELGDASVPFFFDIHGMIFSDNAPKLEYDLHDLLWDKRVNLVNDRKEFFNVSMDEIVAACKKLGCEVELTLLAEAKEYRQTKARRGGGIASASEGEQLAQAFEGTSQHPRKPEG